MHEKAKQVSSEIMKPVFDALADAVRPLRTTISTTIDTATIAKLSTVDVGALFPALDNSSWFARLPLDLPLLDLRGLVSPQAASAAAIEPAFGPTTTDESWIDLDAIEPPNASLAEIEVAAEARGQEIRQQSEILRDLLSETRAAAAFGEEALLLSRASLGEAKSAKRAGWIAVWVAVIAVVVAVVLAV